MSDTARLVLFSLAVIVGGALAVLKVISGDAWLTLTLGLLIPSPLDARRGGSPPASSLPAGATVTALALGLSLRALSLLGPWQASP